MSEKRISYSLVEGGKAPYKASAGAAAFDLYTRKCRWDDDGGYLEVFLGVKFEIPEGWVGKLYPRSSVSNTGLHMANSVGIIDSDFRGEVRARFYPSVLGAIELLENSEEFKIFINDVYSPGKACAQIMFERSELVILNKVEEESLSETTRGSGGFGSTGTGVNVQEASL